MKRNINVWLSLVCPVLGTWPTTQACAQTGNRTGDLSFCRWVLSPLSHTSQDKKLPNFHGMDLTCDKTCSMVKKTADHD